MMKYIKQNKFLILYILFGVLTTLINWASYYFYYNIAHLSNILSNIIAWILAVLFAFITNKLWVFESKSFKVKTLIYELFTFLTSRILTGILDVVIMYVTVDIFTMNSTIWKLISNVIVIIINFVLSKLIIFKNK